MTRNLIKGRLMIPSPFCSGNRTDKSFQAHPWLPVDQKNRAFYCPVCQAKGEV